MRTLLVSLLMPCRMEEADHALGIKTICLPAQRSLTLARFLGALPWWVAKKYDGAQNFVNLLLRPEAHLLNRIPRFSVGPSFSGRHEALLP